VNIYDDADLYDEQYTSYRDDMSLYTRLADDYGGPVLELGAGTARLSTALARAGHRVVGVELSAAMLLRAQDRVKRDKLSDVITLHHGDMREFRTADRFNLVIAPFNTFMHAYTLADQNATLATVKRHLADGGLFALDLYNPNFKHLNTLRREAEWTHVGGADTELFVYQIHDPDSQTIISRYYLDSVKADGSLGRKTATLTQRYFTKFELTRALQQAGFSQIQLYGDFEKGRYTTEAPHMVVLARV